jgi:exodeoxyribonuclease VII small subunit
MRVSFHRCPSGAGAPPWRTLPRAGRTLDPMPKASATPASEWPATYEAALQELEQLVAAMDAGQLPLDQLLAQYQRGAALLRFCREKLDAVEQQIRVFEDGQAKPWSAP